MTITYNYTRYGSRYFVQSLTFKLTTQTSGEANIFVVRKYLKLDSQNINLHKKDLQAEACAPSQKQHIKTFWLSANIIGL